MSNSYNLNDFDKKRCYNYGKLDCLNESLIKIIYMKLKIIKPDYSGFKNKLNTYYNKKFLIDKKDSYENGYDDIIKLNILTIIKQKYENKSSYIKKR